MGFKTIHYNVPKAIKATHFLMQCGYSKQDTQKLLDKKRVRQNNIIIQKSDILSEGIIEILRFIPDDIGFMPFFACLPPAHTMAKLSNKVMQISTSKDFPYFCLFNKPAKILTHPKNLSNSKSMLDALRYHFGKDCNPCHRLDYETSGLLLCAVDKKSEVILKNMFLERRIKKTYLAVVRGIITEPIYIESTISFAKRFGNLCIKGEANNIKATIIAKDKIDAIVNNFTQENNNKAVSIIEPLRVFKDSSELIRYFKSDNPFLSLQYFRYSKITDIQNIDTFPNMDFWDTKSQIKHYNMWLSQLQLDCYMKSVPICKESTNKMRLKKNEQFSLVKLMPLSGKTHQLRIHTSSIHHAILGDTLYGVHTAFASFFLDMQSKKTIHNFKAYLCSTVSKIHSSDIEKPYAIYKYQRYKNIPQKILYLACKKYLLQKDSNGCIKYNPTFIYPLLSITLVRFITPCFFSHTTIDVQQEDIFFKFLLFYYGMPSRQEYIMQDMRLYYCGAERLLLHAFKLQLLDKSFTCPI